MLYFIGGAPRTGKSILSQQVSAKLKIGWISTDLLVEILRVKNDPGVKREWNADPQAITAAAEWFLPYLERFTWGVSFLAGSYLIEGVDFLPAHVARLAESYEIRTIFLGRSTMTLEQFNRYPGRSAGYAFLPEVLKQRIVHDVPLWSEFIRQLAGRFGYPYIDMSGDFTSRLREAEAALMS
jgi:hypothetical protein